MSFSQVIVECQKHDDYQSAIRWLLGFLEEYAGHAHTAASKTSNSHTALKGQPALNQAFSEIRTLLERFADGKSFDNINQGVNVLYDDAREDENLRNWFKDVDAFARKVQLSFGIGYYLGNY